MTSNNKIKFLPKWVWAIALLQMILVAFFSIGTAINPSDFIPGSTGLDYVTQLYITRNLTIVVGIAVALALKSHRALLTVFIVRLLTDLSDIASIYIMNLEDNKAFVPMVVILLVIPAIAVIVYLSKRIQLKNTIA